MKKERTKEGKRQPDKLLGGLVCCSGVLFAVLSIGYGRSLAQTRPAVRRGAAPALGGDKDDLCPTFRAGLMPPPVLMAPPASDDEPDDAPADDAAPTPPTGLRKLTREEINRIRYMEGHPDFRGERSRRAFRKLTAPQKLHHIAYYKGAKYADKVEIKSDPEVFVEFRKQVLPIAIRGCAKPSCHASTNEDETIRFRLFKDPKKTPATTFADFIILNDLEVGVYRVIDRSQPENSLLLTYMLPSKDVKPEMRHPGGFELKPVFRSRKTAGFRRIQKWIASLKHPQEKYGVRLVPSRQDPATPPDDPAQEPDDLDTKDEEPKEVP